MKKLLLALMLCFTFTTQSFSFSIPSIANSQNDSSVLSSTLLAQLLEDNLAQSQNMLEMSKNLKVSSQNINSIDGINKDYILAMLKLSSDIGTMADRIGTMADRIIQTEVLIGDMANRIVQVAQMIINNNAQTQLNLLKAQENFNDLLVQLR